MTSPLTLLPMLAAVVAGHFGVTALFAGIVGGGVLYLVWALRVRPEASAVVERAEKGAPPAAGEP